MVIKLLWIMLLGSHLFAHKIEGLNLIITPLENDVIAIEGRMKSSNKKLEGNKIALISMIDKRIIQEAFLESNKPLQLKIPDESYWVYMYVGDQDVVEEGIAPKKGFTKMAISQKERAFRTTLGMGLGFLSLFMIIFMYRVKKYYDKIKILT